MAVAHGLLAAVASPAAGLYLQGAQAAVVTSVGSLVAVPGRFSVRRA